MQRIPVSVGTVIEDGPDHCVFEAGGNDLDAMAMHIGALPWELELLGPPELREAMARQAERLARAAAGPPSTDRRSPAARMGT